MGKQALVFCATKRSAEITAEIIAKSCKYLNQNLKLSEQVLNSLPQPTKQCHKLANCIKKGVAFHHAGLHPLQRKLIEFNFKQGKLKIISCTPTLAMGINMPAFRTIIKDLKRYDQKQGLKWIPTLEYHQMAGRAGRPDFNDTHGEAICIAEKKSDINEILERYIFSPPEKILSKMNYEQNLRSCCLTLISLGFAKSKYDILEFFKNTLYAKQYANINEIYNILDKILKQLQEWEFIKISKNPEIENQKIQPTLIGKRITELYIDPLTANQIIVSLKKASQKKVVDEISFVNLACSVQELKPLPSVKPSEFEKLKSLKSGLNIITCEPSIFEPEYDEFIKSVKLTLALKDWMNEKNENEIFEKYNISPGELHLKRELCNWLIYTTEKLAEMLLLKKFIKIIRKAKFRLEKGIKKELIPLAKIKNVGRVRARLLYKNGIKNIEDVKKTDVSLLSKILGKKTAVKLKEELSKKK